MKELYLDAVLMPVSVFLVVGYHVHLWRILKNKPGATTMGVQWEGRRGWLERTLRGGGGGGDGVGKSMQVVQSFRNNLMIIILRASISIIISSSVAALTNNAYKTRISIIGQVSSSQVFAAEYAAAFVVSVCSFVCSSLGVAFLVDACILVTTATAPAQEVPSDYRPTSSHIQRLVDTGFKLAFIGNRLIWLTFPLLLWSLTPIAVALSSLALIWGFSAMDFVAKSVTAPNAVHLYK